VKSPDLIDAIQPVIKAFERLGVDYYIGGSIASSAYGVARATIDVDMVSELKEEHAHPLAEMLKSVYYIDEEMILNKLSWFQQGCEIAERQWYDILGVIRVQGNLLDKEYLCKWAEELGVKDLLERAFTETGVRCEP
jgi:hypothetical protein